MDKGNFQELNTIDYTCMCMCMCISLPEEQIRYIFHDIYNSFACFSLKTNEAMGTH